MVFGNDTCLEIRNNVCPYCGEIIISNSRVFANHVRWCKSNPKYNDTRNSMIDKIKKSSIKRKEYSLICEICGKEYTVSCTPESFSKGKYKKTCSRKCASILTLKKTDVKERNNKIRQHHKNIHTETECVCEYCGKVFYATRKRKFCSSDCVKSNKCKRLKPFSVYSKQCEFDFSIKKYAIEFDIDLIKKYGWYSPTNKNNNLDGVSRDHMISRRYAFDNNIDPYYISHPANCLIIKQKDNSKKHTKSTLTIEQLKNKVKEWNNKYGEHINNIDYALLEDKGIVIKDRYIS